MKQSVAAFDFDGTIASGDAVLPFASAVIGRFGTLRALFKTLPHARHMDRDILKEQFVANAFKGLPQDRLAEVGRQFARHLQVEKVRPLMLERIEWHRERGHRLVMVSASFDLYLEPLAGMLGFDEVLCTHIEFEDGVATGKLHGGNIRANAKARELARLFDGMDVDLWAYGNSAGDVPMLARADHAFWVTTTGQIRAWSDDPRKVVDLRSQDEDRSI